MDYVEQHKQWCDEVRARALAYISKTGKGKTYFCRQAGVQIHALAALEKGTATPATIQGLSDHLDRVESAA